MDRFARRHRKNRALARGKDMNAERILLTGSSGTLGHNLLKSLADKGDMEVLALLRADSRQPTTEASVQFERLNFFDRGAIARVIERFLPTCVIPFTIAGDGKQVRDLLFVDDAANCYLAAAEQIEHARGQAFNIGGGITNSSSLLELFAQLEKTLGLELRYKKLPWRHDDQKFFVANNSKAKRLLGWQPQVEKKDGASRTLHWVAATLPKA